MLWAILIGVITALLSSIFNNSIEILSAGILQVNNALFSFYIFPLFGGLLLGIINKFFITKDRSFELVAVEKEIFHYESQLLTIKSVIKKTIASIISLIFGFSLGKQGTIIYIGGFVGSYIGYFVGRKKDTIESFVSCGTAGMISGIFGMPLLGVVLSLELILTKISIKKVLKLFISAYVAYFILDFIFNQKIFIKIFYLNNYIFRLNHIIPVILFSLTIAIFGMFYNYVIGNMFKKYIFKAPFFSSVVSGVLICICGIYFVEIYSLHISVFEKVLYFLEDYKYLLILVLIKILLTGVSYNLGGYGGVFLPGITIGAFLGKIFYILSGIMNPSICIILGISCFFTSFSGAVFSGIILGFCLSGRFYEVLPIIIFSNLLVYFILRISPIKFLYYKRK